MKTSFLLSIIFLIGLSCNFSNKKLNAQDIIDRAIVAHCNSNCDRSTILFTFRNNVYKAVKNDGMYCYERIITKGDSVIKDVLSNSSFKRFINDSLINLPKKTEINLANSVNSVHYFAQLPYGLNAPAVNKKYIGETTIKNKVYYKIAVSFKQEGGGLDFEDKFVYWINKTNFSLDYLAYSYAVNGGGVRFREAFNKRVVNGITFLDYNNYMPLKKDVELSKTDKLFQNGQLKLISKIITEQVSVKLN